MRKLTPEQLGLLRDVASTGQIHADMLFEHIDALTAENAEMRELLGRAYCNLQASRRFADVLAMWLSDYRTFIARLEANHAD